MKGSPAFSFYPKDYESDEHVKLMSLEQEGAYVRLLCHSWLHGSIPSDLGSLARICRIPPAKMAKLWPGILPCWVDTERGRLLNARLEQERQKQEAFRSKQSEKGKKGAATRWPEPRSTLSRGHPAATGLPVPADSLPFPSPSVVRTTKSKTEHNGIADASRPPSWNHSACEALIRRYGGTAPGARITKALRPLVEKYGSEVVLEAWGGYLDETPAEYASAERFASTYGRWAKKAKPTDEPPTPESQEALDWLEARGGILAVRVKADGSGLSRAAWCQREGAPTLTLALLGHARASA